MKTTKIIYWITTSLVFVFETVIPAFTFNSELARQGISHLQFPDYFRVQLTMLKIIGGLLLILPMVPWRLKEWAYAGFTFVFLCAFMAHFAVDGAGGQTFFPLIVLAVLAASYVSYRKIQSAQLVTA